MLSSYLKKLSWQILRELPDGIIVVNIKTLKILDVNSTATSMFGYKKNEMLGMDVFNLHPSEQKQSIKEFLQQLSLRKLQYYCEVPCVRRNGELFFVDIASEVKEHAGRTVAIGLFRERCKLKQEATAWSAIYQHLAEMVGYGVCLASDHRIVYANQVFVDMLGATSFLQVTGRNVTDLIPVDQQEEYKRNYEIVVSGIKPTVTVKRRLRKFNGTEVSVYVKASRILLRGKWTIQALFFVPSMDFKNTSSFVDQSRPENTPSISLLTKRETETLCLIASGNTVKEIASKFNITVRTVRTHKRNLMSKLQIHSTANLTRFAIRNRIVDADE